MVGAFSCFGLDRREAVWKVQGLVNRSAEEFSSKNSETNQITLPSMSSSDVSIADYNGLGLSTTNHPMQFLRGYLNELKVKRACGLNNANEETIGVAGLVIIRQRPV